MIDSYEVNLPSPGKSEHSFGLVIIVEIFFGFTS